MLKINNLSMSTHIAHIGKTYIYWNRNTHTHTHTDTYTHTHTHTHTLTEAFQSPRLKPLLPVKSRLSLTKRWREQEALWSARETPLKWAAVTLPSPLPLPFFSSLSLSL